MVFSDFHFYSEVLGIQTGEGLLIHALDRSLHRRGQYGFQRIDQGDQRQFVELRTQLHPYLRATALCMRGGGHATLRSQPVMHRRCGWWIGR